MPIAKFFLFPFVFLFVFVLQSKHSLDVTLHIEIHKICLFVYLHFVIALCFNTIQSFIAKYNFEIDTNRGGAQLHKSNCIYM